MAEGWESGPSGNLEISRRFGPVESKPSRPMTTEEMVAREWMRIMKETWRRIRGEKRTETKGNTLGSWED